TDLGSGVRLGCRSIAVELRIGDERGVGVPGRVDFGNDRDTAGRGIADELGIVVLGEEPARAPTNFVLRADVGEFGTGRDLDTPTLIVGQVQVEAVDLVER